jgi:hypothetical protein
MATVSSDDKVNGREQRGWVFENSKRSAGTMNGVASLHHTDEGRAEGSGEHSVQPAAETLRREVDDLLLFQQVIEVRRCWFVVDPNEEVPADVSETTGQSDERQLERALVYVARDPLPISPLLWAWYRARRATPQVVPPTHGTVPGDLGGVGEPCGIVRWHPQVYACVAGPREADEPLGEAVARRCQRRGRGESAPKAAERAGVLYLVRLMGAAD